MDAALAASVHLVVVGGLGDRPAGALLHCGKHARNGDAAVLALERLLAFLLGAGPEGTGVDGMLVAFHGRWSR